MLKQTILASIVANDIEGFQRALSDIADLKEITYEEDEAALTLQVLSKAFHISKFDLGNRVVHRADFSDRKKKLQIRKVPSYIRLLIDKSISEGEARDFVVAYYGVVATDDDGGYRKIDRSILGILCLQFDLVDAVSIAMAKFLNCFANEMTKSCWSYLDFLS